MYFVLDRERSHQSHVSSLGLRHEEHISLHQRFHRQVSGYDRDLSSND